MLMIEPKTAVNPEDVSWMLGCGWIRDSSVMRGTGKQEARAVSVTIFATFAFIVHAMVLEENAAKR